MIQSHSIVRIRHSEVKKLLQRKKKTYPDLNSYDYSWFAREMTEEELYKVNGGQVMSQADQYAMAQAHTQGDQETMDAIVSKYENKDEPAPTTTGSSSGNSGSSGSAGSTSEVTNVSNNTQTSIPANTVDQNSQNQSDQYAMAQTHTKGDQETMDTKVIYTPQSIRGTHTYSKLSYALIEGVGFVAESIKQGYFVDENNQLSVTNCGSFSQKNNITVDSYVFYGEITLILDGEKKETKVITVPKEDRIWDGTYDYIGAVTFDTQIPNFGSVQIETDIDMLINNASVNFVKDQMTLRN